MARNDRTSIESTDIVAIVDTIDLTEKPEDNDIASSNESPRRRSPRKRKLKYETLKGMQGSGSDEHYKIGRSGGAYKGKGAMKNAPKSAH